MDPVERYNDMLASLRTLLDGRQAQIWTALPGIIDAYDATDNTVTAHSAIKGTLQGPDGSIKQIIMPQMYKLPVQWPGGSDAFLSFPLAAGTECLIVFSCRAIDAWWQSGSEQPPIEKRFHDLTDGICIPILMSTPNVPTTAPISTTTTQLRSRDGTFYLEIDQVNSKMNIFGTGPESISAITITPGTHVRINGNLQVTGSITAGFGTGDSVGLQTHTHTQGNDNHGDIEQPTNAPTAGT